MKNSLFNQRIEKKYQIGISESEVAGLCRELSCFLKPHGLSPVQEITSVGSIYFDNKACDLLRYSLLGRLMLVRLRAYELYYGPPRPIADYWVEVKTAQAERRTKRRFLLPKSALADFLEGRDARQDIFDYNRSDADDQTIGALYREAQETILTFGLQPVLLVVYKRIAFQSEVARLSIDWDVQYYNLSTSVYNYSSWKNLGNAAAGKSNNVIMEIKYLQGEIPHWFCKLQRRYPIRPREYLKPVEGMGFLFRGPFRHHAEANSFLHMIDAYMAGSQTLG